MSTDRFGNLIDPGVGYARGRLLKGSADEVRRLRQAGRIAGDFVAREGIDRIGIFTGNLRFFPVGAEDLSTLCEEWIGPGLFGVALKAAAVAHMGGDGSEEAAVVNRTSAGIVATVLALSKGRPVISLVPEGDRSHASVIRGASLANVTLHEVHDEEAVRAAIATHSPALLIITTVTSELSVLPDKTTRAAITAAQDVGVTVFMDEAYGARFRPVLCDGTPSLSFGADLVITNADKAGLSGPRAGVLCGQPAALVPVLAKASELGMEARAPIAVGAMRSLEGFSTQLLIDEAQDGQDLADAIAGLLGENTISRSALGPKIGEDDVLARVLALSGLNKTKRVPAEVTAAIGMLMLRNEGIVTVNTHGQPGGRVSIRLKPTSGAIARVGGANKVAEALITAMREVADHLEDEIWFAQLLFGDT